MLGTLGVGREQLSHCGDQPRLVLAQQLQEYNPGGILGYTRVSHTPQFPVCKMRGAVLGAFTIERFTIPSACIHHVSTKRRVLLREQLCRSRGAKEQS